MRTTLVDPKTVFAWSHRFWHMFAQSRREGGKGKMSTEPSTIWNSSGSREKGKQAMNGTPQLSTLTCPNPACHHQQRAMMPTMYCQLTYMCEACQTTHTRQAGDCCVFCSYADTVCPSKQEAEPCDPSLGRCLSF